MLALQMDQRRQKVDHLPGQKKDVLDAVTAVAFGLVNDRVQRIESGHTDRLLPTLGSRVTGWGGPPNELEQYMPSHDPLIRSFDSMNSPDY